MKKILAALVIALGASTTLAADGYEDYVYDINLATEEVNTNADGAYAGTQDLGDIIRIIIAGAIAADRLDRDHSRRGYRGRVTCYADDRRGRTFAASGNRPRRVQERALNQCERRSYNRCRPLGCRTERWG